MTHTSLSFAQQTELSCLKCWQIFQADLWVVIDIVERPDLLERIIQGALHDISCPNCSSIVHVNSPLLIFRPGELPILIFSPAQEATEEQAQKQAGVLLNYLRQRLESAWEEDWLNQISIVLREVLPNALQDGVEGTGLTMECLVTPEADQFHQEDPQARVELAPKTDQGKENELMEQTLQDFISAGTWAESLEIVEQHPDLLTEAAEKLLGEWLTAEEADKNEKVLRILSEHLALLQRCREIGIVQAFMEKAASTDIPIPPEFRDSLQRADQAIKRHRRGDHRDLDEAVTAWESILSDDRFITSKDQFKLAVYNDAGGVYLQRYWETDDLADLDNTLGLWRQAVTVAPSGSADLAYISNNLGTVWRTRYDHTGDFENLQEGLEAYRQSVAASPVDSLELAGYLNRLGICLYTRYTLTSKLDDLQEALDAYRQAVAATPPNSPEVAGYLNNLGTCLRARYTLNGKLEDLKEALEVYRQAASTASPSSEEWATILNSLGNGLRDLYNQSGQLEDLQEAMKIYRQALSATSPDSPDRVAILNNLGNGLRDCYAQSGDLENLYEALDAYQQSVAGTPPDSPNRATRLNNLGTGLQDLYARSGKLEDLQGELEAYRQAAAITPPGAPDLPMFLNNLGNSLSEYYARSGRLEDLQEALEVYRQAVAATSPDSPDWLMFVNNLGSGLRTRYARTGQMEDLQEALDAYRQVAAATPPGSPDRAARLNNLGNGFRDHYMRTGQIEELQKALDAYRQAVAASASGSPDRAGYLNNLGTGLSYWYARSGRLEDLQEAEAMYQQALADIQPDSPVRSLCLTNLGNSLSSRFTLSHRLEDLQEALDTYRQAVAASKPGSPGLAILLNNLAMGLYDCYTRIGRLEDLQEAESIFQQAAELGLSSAQETGLTAARTWGNWAMERHSWEQAVQAYQIVLRITENLYRTQLLSSNLEVWLRETQGLATHAAYALAKTGHLKRAIEIIEASRARFLREALERSRKDLVGLVDKGHNSLYERYKAMSARWETLRRQGQPDATQIGSEINIMGFDLRSELETAQKQIQGLVDEIRAVPGYQDFLQSLSAKQIMATAADQCLVYLFTTAIGGLALLVQSEQITPIWLDRLTETALREQVLGSQDQTKLGGYLGAYSIWRSAAVNGNISESEKQTASDLWWAALDHTTHWLWDNCLNQVTQILAGQNIQHAVLIPSGLLGLLPLHAAWKEDPVCKTGRYYALDTLQFSYAPSAHSLRAAQERKDRPADAILAVDNPDGSIEFAREATEVAIAHFDPQQVIRLEKNQAAPEQVKTELQQAAVLQFYTHGTASFTEPLDHSFLLLASGLHLTLREILDLKLDRARLAFLAACETGIPGTQIIDEVVSLPAGMMQAGVPGIIGSLWIVSDISTMLLVARFYNLWKSKDSQLSPAEALRQAQIWLRDTTNQEKRDYLHSTALIPGAAARSASDHLLLEFPQHERSFAHPYYWAAFGYTGL